MKHVGCFKKQRVEYSGAADEQKPEAAQGFQASPGLSRRGQVRGRGRARGGARATPVAAVSRTAPAGAPDARALGTALLVPWGELLSGGASAGGHLGVWGPPQPPLSPGRCPAAGLDGDPRPGASGESRDERPRPGRGVAGRYRAFRMERQEFKAWSATCRVPRGWGAVGVSYSTFVCLSFLHLS